MKQDAQVESEVIRDSLPCHRAGGKDPSEQQGETEEDDAESLQSLRKAAEQDDPEALFELFMLLQERDEPGDDAESFRCLRKAAELGYIEAQIALGYRYANGHGLPQDDVEAAHWNRMAAEQGSAEAQYELGCAYENGWGVEMDTGEAIRWYGMAAKQSDSESAEALKRLGLDVDEVVADLEARRKRIGEGVEEIAG